MESCETCKKNGTTSCPWPTKIVASTGQKVGICNGHVKNMRVEKAIVYFQEAIKESDEIIEVASDMLKRELTEQREHFVTALAALENFVRNGSYYFK